MRTHGGACVLHAGALEADEAAKVEDAVRWDLRAHRGRAVGTLASLATRKFKVGARCHGRIAGHPARARRSAHGQPPRGHERCTTRMAPRSRKVHRSAPLRRTRPSQSAQNLLSGLLRSSMICCRKRSAAESGFFTPAAAIVSPSAAAAAAAVGRPPKKARASAVRRGGLIVPFCRNSAGVHPLPFHPRLRWILPRFHPSHPQRFLWEQRPRAASRSYSVAVSTRDSESLNPSSSLGRTYRRGPISFFNHFSVTATAETAVQ